MNKSTKIIAMVAGAFFALLVVLIIGAVTFSYIFNRQYGAEIEENNNKGKEFGKTVDNESCQREGFRQIKELYYSDLNIKDLLKLQYFTENCLKASRPNPDFCINVPTEQQDIWNRDSWKMKNAVNSDGRQTIISVAGLF
jgi:hypothetical protein